MDVNNVVDVMNSFKGDGVMPIGVDTAIKAIRPGARWEITVAGGEYIFHKWWDPNGLKPPPLEPAETPPGPAVNVLPAAIITSVSLCRLVMNWRWLRKISIRWLSRWNRWRSSALP